MSMGSARIHRLPLEDELGLHRIVNATGIEISVLPNGCVFAIEHVRGEERTLVNQIFGSPLGGGIGRLALRLGAGETVMTIAGAGASALVGRARDRFVWSGAGGGFRHRVTLWLHPDEPFWLWHVALENARLEPAVCDAILIQDLGLAARAMVLGNEAYASQYIDHAVIADPHCGPVVMSRQNLRQSGRNPWVMHGCLDGAANFATDALQIFGPAFRQTADLSVCLQGGLPGEKLQHEAACAAVQSTALTLAPGESAALRFFGLFEADHPDATSGEDLSRLQKAEAAARDFQPAETPLAEPPRSLFESAPLLSAMTPEPAAIARAYPERIHEERHGEELLSFFIPDGARNRHVVLAAKEARMRRRHGAILRSGDAILPDEGALSATCWMHGVFAAQLTIGNTALHKLFSVSRDAYNITRAGGLRILADRGEGWRLLGVPSLFEMGLNGCRWIYLFEDGSVGVQAVVSAADTAMQWHIEASGKPCRFAICGHIVMGEHEYRHPATVEIDAETKRIAFRPDPDGLWGRTYPSAVHYLVTATPDAVEAMGTGALLYEGNTPRAADAYAVFRTKPVEAVSFALVGDLKDPRRALALAARYECGPAPSEAHAAASAFWSRMTQAKRFSRIAADGAALDTIFPWFVQNALIHLSAPRGLEQYTAAAWGTRDVCQGPVECLLALGHHPAVREILRIVFSQQYEATGDWPQWFMLDPYGEIRDRHSHGDILIWPLKALCDYLEATGDLAILGEPLPWTRDDFRKTAYKDTVAIHVERLLATVGSRFIPGTHLIRYGLGDWNDSLQPADPAMRDWMVSSWTVALLYQQLRRYTPWLRRTGRQRQADELTRHADHMREDFNRWLMPDGTVAGYALFQPEGSEPDYLLHPRDRRTGVRYSLIPMTRAILAGLFTPEQARHHLRLIREHLLFPDGARLMDRPIEYRGGVERNFRRAESAAFFGREIGLMYTHAHLRYCEALGVLGETEAMRKALMLVNPIAVDAEAPSASLRQRNAYFSSSDAAFADRYRASAEWARVRQGEVALDGGWRVYSSGAGMFVRLALPFLRDDG